MNIFQLCVLQVLMKMVKVYVNNEQGLSPDEFCISIFTNDARRIDEELKELQVQVEYHL